MGKSIHYPKYRPIVRVDNYILFPNGTSRKLTWRERWSMRKGEPFYLDLNTGKPTKLIGTERAGPY